MATSFRLGGGLVPVIEHVNLTGQPTQHPNAASARFTFFIGLLKNQSKP